MLAIRRGYTVKKDSKSYNEFHIFDKHSKFYLVPYSHGDGNDAVWSIAETSNYRLEQFDIEKPVAISGSYIELIKRFK